MSVIDLQNPIAKDHPVNKGLILHWLSLPDAGWSHDLYFRDVSGRNNHGLLAGSAPIRRHMPARIGGHGYVACPIGYSSEVQGPILTAINGATALSMGGWLYRSLSSNVCSFNRNMVGGVTKLGVALRNDGKAYFYLDNGTTVVTGTVPYSGVGWTRLDMTFNAANPNDTTKFRGFINGIQQTITITGAIPSTIPADTTNAIYANRFDGSLGSGTAYDDLTIHLRCLSIDEIKWRYTESQVTNPRYYNYVTPAVEITDDIFLKLVPNTITKATTVSNPTITLSAAPQTISPSTIAAPANEVKGPLLILGEGPRYFVPVTVDSPATVRDPTIKAPGAARTVVPGPIAPHTNVPQPRTDVFSPPAPGEPIAGAHRQIVVDQEPGGTNYPFLLPSHNLGELIADFYLQYKDDAREVKLPLHVTDLSGFGTEGAAPPAHSHEYDLIIKDDDDQVVFNSTDVSNYLVTPWGTDKRIIEWSNPATYEVCRAVIWIAWAPEETPILFDKYIQPDDGRLDGRAYERRPDQVTQLIVDLNDGTSVTHPVGKNIIFQAGYNYEMSAVPTQEADGGALRNIIAMAAVPGAGIGKFPGCEDQTIAVHRINGVTADASGNISMDALACYRAGLELESVSGGNATIVKSTTLISNNCKPCYTCEDFVLVYNALHRLYLKYKALGQRAEVTRDLLAVNIDRWEASRECRKGHVIRTSTMALGACRVGLGAAVCNNTDQPLQNVTLTIKLKSTAPSLCLVCNSVFRKGNVDPHSAAPPNQSQPYAFGGTFPDSIKVHFDCISPATLGTVVFQVEAIDASDSDTVTMIVSSSAGIVAPQKQQTVGVRCSSVTNPLCCENKTTTTKTTASVVATMFKSDNGNIAKLVSDPDGQLALVLPYGNYSHGLTGNDEVSIRDTTPPTYTGKHRIRKLYSPRVLILDTKFDGEAAGGHWLKV